MKTIKIGQSNIQQEFINYIKTHVKINLPLIEQQATQWINGEGKIIAEKHHTPNMGYDLGAIFNEFSQYLKNQQLQQIRG